MAFLLALFVLLFCLSCGWIFRMLVADRDYWRNQHAALLQQAREAETAARQRERHLFDQMLLLKGFRTPEQPLTVNTKDQLRPVSPLSSDEMDVLTDRIAEWQEVGILSPADALKYHQRVTAGEMTPGELDRELLSKRVALNGSIAPDEVYAAA